MNDVTSITGIERYQPKTRAEWQALRRRDVTASQDIPALLDVHPKKTPLQVWQEKTNRKVSDDDLETGPMKRGRKMQKPIFEEAVEHLPDYRLEHNTINEYWRDPVLRIGCTPDVIGHHPELGKGVIELKSVHPLFYSKDWLNGYPPAHIVLQTQIQARLLGAEWAKVAVLRSEHGWEFDTIDIPLLTAEGWHTLVGHVQDFWRMVDSDTPPAPDFARDGAVIAELAGPSDGTHIDLSTDNELVDALYKREEHKKLMGMLDEELEAIDAMIRFKAGSHEVLTAGDFRLTLKTEQVKQYVVAARTRRPIRAKRIRNSELSRPA